MKVEIFTEGIGRVIASGYAMRHCISFLKSVYPKRFRWIKKDGVDFDMVYAVNYKLRDKWIDEAMKTNHQEIKSDVDCPNCADQASIAAPGQTVLCKTHEDEKHFREMKEFFTEECERLIFKSALPFCSCCGTEKTVVYVGIIISVTGHPLTFSFCVDCRDELTLKQNAARAALERIGA